MLSRLLATFAALFLSAVCGAGWAAHDRAESLASLTPADASASILDASLQLPSPAERTAADEDAIPADVEGEGSMDLPDLVQHPADPWVSTPCRAPPAPHRVAIWRAPVLDGLRRPPRRLPTAA